MIRKRSKKTFGVLQRPLLLAIFVALFFSLSMTWVELDPVIDHQRNVDNLRLNQHQSLDQNLFSEKIMENNLGSERRVRHTDGIVFGSALLVMIVIGGVMANIRNSD